MCKLIIETYLIILQNHYIEKQEKQKDCHQFVLKSLGYSDIINSMNSVYLLKWGGGGRGREFEQGFLEEF